MLHHHSIHADLPLGFPRVCNGKINQSFLGGSCPHEACVPHHILSECAKELDRAKWFSGQLWFPEFDPKKVSILDCIELVKEGEEWKLNIPAVLTETRKNAVGVFAERVKGYSKEFSNIRIYINNDRYTPEQFENEIISKLRDMKAR